MLLAGLARALAFLGDFDGQRRGAAGAIAMARRLDDRLGLATVLMRSYWSRGERSLEHTLEMLSEARDLAEELGDDRDRGRGAGVADRRTDRARRADRGRARARRACSRWRSACASRSSLHVAEHYASTLALCDGRLADAEAAAQRSHEWSRLLTGRDASGIYGIQMFGIRREQGRLAELAPAIRGVAVAAVGPAAPGGPASPRCWPSSAWTTRRGGARPRPRRASTRCAPSSGWRR